MMQTSRWWMAVLAGAVVWMAAPTEARAEVRLGAGANYWVMLEDIDIDEVDEEGFSYLATLQFRSSMVGLGLDVEMMPDRFGEDAYAGQAYLILGEGIYGAAGIGINNIDGDFAEEPFYNLRVGIDLELLPGLRLDINANYRFNEVAEIENVADEIDTDTVFLGAALRIAF